MTDLSGTTLGQYQLLELIGKGGMANVYRAHQPSMDRDVAIKIISAELAADPEFMARFEREAQIIAKLQHPNILTVYDFGRTDDKTYLVMRLMEGGSLAQELRQGPLPIRRVVHLTRQIASALDYAHLRGIVHRDLKPTNVLLDRDGNAYLTDFGIAKMLTGGPTTGLTATGAVMGTPTYMAPEQWRAEPVDGRTDVYALGVILYQMLLGQVPFAAETPHGLMYQHLDMQPPSPHALNPDLPMSIEPVISKALAKRREDRYASATDLAQALEEALRAPARLPEQTEFEGVGTGEVTELDNNLADYEQQLYEDEMLADEDQQPTIPPTEPLPPPYSEPVTQPAPPPPAYEPPIYEQPPEQVSPYGPPAYGRPPEQAPGYQAPPQQPPLYEPPPPQPRYQLPGGLELSRGVWIAGITIIGIVLLVALVALGSLLFSSNPERSPTPPPATATIPPELRPNISITSPSNNTTVDLGDEIAIKFVATARNGLTRIDLRRFNIVLDSISVGGQTSYQGEFAYRPDSTGTHIIELVPYSDNVPGDPATITILVQ